MTPAVFLFSVIASIGPLNVSAAEAGPISVMISVRLSVVDFGSPKMPISETIEIKAGKSASSP